MWPGPRDSDDVEVRAHYSAELAEGRDAVFSEMGIIKNNTSRLEFTDGLFKLGNLPAGLEEPPVTLHERLEQVGLANAGLPNEDKIAHSAAQILEVTFTPNERHLWGWPSCRR